MKSPLLSTSLIVCLLFSYCTGVGAADWPTWRGNANRSAATSESLSDALHLQWSIQRPPLKPAWPEDKRLQFDASYEPIVMGTTMYVGSAINDSVAAYDLESGKRIWQFFTDGPVRFAPLADGPFVYAGSDDGRLYCLDAKSGELVWRYTAAPAHRRAIGSERVVSVWPIRGGPVVSENRVYFTAGVWPFEGTMIFSIDTRSINADSVGANRELNTEHVTSSSLNNLAPQGYLATSGQNLFVPCGRAKVYAINRGTGKSIGLNYDSKGLTDYHAIASDNWLLHGDKIVDVAGAALPIAMHRPVVEAGKVYGSQGGKAVAYDLKDQVEVEKKDRRGKVVKVKIPRKLWTVQGQAVSLIHVKADNRLYGHHGNRVIAIEIPDGEAEAKVAWTADVNGTPSSMIAAAGKLIVVTEEGGIHCFGEMKVEPQTVTEVGGTIPTTEDGWAAKAESILEQPGTSDGYGLVLGIGSGRLVEELLRQSDLRLIAVDSNEQKVAALRQRMDALGLYGTRIVAQVGDPLAMSFPPYMANVIVSEDLDDVGSGRAPFLPHVFQTLRPYGGKAFLDLSAGAHEKLALSSKSLSNASVERMGATSILTRVGALQGAADWTHEFGGAANTLMSKEKLVKAPLGVLWFGGPSSDGSLFYDRHEWGPSMAVKGGRMFIQGPGKLTAVDVYTGRILWQNKVPVGKSLGRGSNWGPTGYHFVVEEDAFYLTYSDKCLKINPATGEQVAVFSLPDPEDKWGRIRVWKDQIIVAAFTTTKEHGVRPTKLVSLDRHSGKILWSKESRFSYPLVAIGNGKVFCYEGRLDGLYIGNSKIRVGGVPKADEFLYLNAFDAKTGDQLWRNTTSRSASWVSYSEDHDVLLVSNKNGIDAVQGATGEELWNKVAEGKGFRGHPENYWDKVIIWKDRIIDQRGPGLAYDVRTGKPKLQLHPITGKEEPWSFTKAGHHCNYAIASEHLMTFRAASAGFCDLESGDTGRLEGFRPGCRNSLIPANGVLNAPNMAHGCTCSYSIFTSLALVHVPQTEYWTYSDEKQSDGPIQQIGINLGAAGDRQATNGTLWLDYPSHSGGSPLNFPVKVAGDELQWFRVHSSKIEGEGLPWVSSSGVRNVRSITVPLVSGKVENEGPERSFTVRLFFAEPDAGEPGANLFDVSLQGKRVLEGFDPVRQANGPHRSIVKEFVGVKATGSLTVDFKALKGHAFVSGIEVVAE